MVYERGGFWSSFDANKSIKVNKYALTVFSGASWTGGHASMWLEHFESDNASLGETKMIDLIAFGSEIQINIEIAQVGLTNAILDNDWSYQNTDTTFKGLPKTQVQLIKSNHRTYDITSAQRDAVLTAVARFARKVSKGRYVYSLVGGGLGRVFSLPGRRGINCADFILKILNETGIGNRYSLPFNTPSRLAKRR